jgi:hypothetical protein
VKGRTEVRAVVTVGIEVDPASVWGPNATVEQIRKQAIEDALGRLGRVVDGHPEIRLVGEPRVTVVTIEAQ